MLRRPPMMDTKLGNVPECIQLYLIQARISPPNPSALYKLKHSGHPAPPAWYRSPTSELFTEMEPILFPKCSIPTIADTDSNRLRTGIPIDRGQHSDDCGQELPSTASWVHMTRVRVKLATVGSRFFGLPEARHRPRSQ